MNITLEDICSNLDIRNIRMMSKSAAEKPLRDHREFIDLMRYLLEDMLDEANRGMFSIIENFKSLENRACITSYSIGMLSSRDITEEVVSILTSRGFKASYDMCSMLLTVSWKEDEMESKK